MSHFSAVRTNITDVGLLKQSIRSCGYVVREQDIVRGYQGTARADVVALLQGGYDLGFVLHGGTYHVIGDFNMGTCSVEDRLESLRLSEVYRQIQRTYAELYARRWIEQNERSSVHVLDRVSEGVT